MRAASHEAAFHFFPQLPIELRLMIWELALHSACFQPLPKKDEGRIVHAIELIHPKELRAPGTTYGHLDPPTDYIAAFPVRTWPGTPPNRLSLLDVNHESRQFAIKHCLHVPCYSRPSKSWGIFYVPPTYHIRENPQNGLQDRIFTQWHFKVVLSYPFPNPQHPDVYGGYGFAPEQITWRFCRHLSAITNARSDLGVKLGVWTGNKGSTVKHITRKGKHAHETFEHLGSEASIWLSTGYFTKDQAHGGFGFHV
ncbi:hypothetical protein QBC43DRAFT_299366 [Cladorrhinum sp. PSN259]|nr:hypothetical protein QBC43DRAFT_299366 [Cladorrhinum sp. PSN259]